MDLPFLFKLDATTVFGVPGFNPYSNGSSFFMVIQKNISLDMTTVSILILMDLPFLFKTKSINEFTIFNKCSILYIYKFARYSET